MPVSQLPDYIHELSLKGKIKQCQNTVCMTRETKSQPLFACAGCKRSQYCSKECQKADWKLHKPLCILQRNDREAVKDEALRDTSKLILGLNEPQAEALSRKWIQHFQGVMLEAAYLALDMYHFPERTYTHILLVTLDPNFTEKNIPRQGADIVKAFAFIDARVVRWSEIGINPAQNPQLKAVFDKADNVEQKLGGTRSAFAVLYIPVLFRIFRVCPLALVGPQFKPTVASDSLEWKAILARQINGGVPIL